MTTIITSPAWQNADLKNELQPSSPTVLTLAYYADRPGWIDKWDETVDIGRQYK
jgi:hypothetical protein